MQFMVYLAMRADEPMSPPTPEGMAEMGRFMEDSMKSGMVVSTGQLDSTTTRLRLKGGEVSLSDGPFIEGKELVPGFTIIKVSDQKEAIEWATKLRACMGDGEIRLARVNMPGFEE